MRIVGIVTALALCVLQTGCRTSRIVDTLVSDRESSAQSSEVTYDPPQPDLPHSHVQAAAAQLNRRDGTSPVRPVSTSPESPDAAYVETLAEIEELGRIDPAARDLLMQQLKTVKPSLWPLAVRQFKSGWQQHQRLNTPDNTPPSVPVSYPQTPHTAPHTRPIETLPMLPRQSSVMPFAPPDAVDARPRLDGRLASHVAKPVEEPPREARTPWPEFRNQVLQAGYETSEAPMSGTGPPAPLGGHHNSSPLLGWRVSVDQAIEQLAELATDEPRTRHEAYMQARMRLLQLVAGDKQSAVETVPGLTPTEQSYWSHQLMAMATLLGESRQIDHDSRISLAARHLEDAAAQLSELADLQVRNLAFFDKIYGFGDYDVVEEYRFKAGQEVRLYVEVDNYRSDSTAEGYRTVIDSSYEVLDAAGNRVEGEEFAPVVDRCRSRRRDFYVEYSLRMPERVYPGKYQLKLTLHDRLADKLGSQTIDFEIVDEGNPR